MRTTVLVLGFSALCLLVVFGVGCPNTQADRSLDVVRYLEVLLAQNHLPHDPLMPNEAERKYIQMKRFAGGFAIGWRAPETGDAASEGMSAHTLLFYEDGQFMCEPYDYTLGDVTADGTPDVVTLELCGMLQGIGSGTIVCMVYPMDSRHRPSRFIGTVPVDAAYLRDSVADVTGDGVPEVIIIQQEPDIHPESPACGEDIPGYLGVWSVKHGLPRLLLAVKAYPYEVLEPGNMGGLFGIRVWTEAGKATGKPEWATITWNQRAQKFDVSDARNKGIRVLQNIAMLD